MAKRIVGLLAGLFLTGCIEYRPVTVTCGAPPFGTQPMSVTYESARVDDAVQGAFAVYYNKNGHNYRARYPLTCTYAYH